MRASVWSRSSATTRRKRRARKKASAPSPQVRSRTAPPAIRLWAEQASLEACSNASGGRMHCAEAYEGSFASARARYLTCVATSRAWGMLRSKATSSGSRPRLAAMARCTSSVSSSVYSPGVIMPANVRFFSARKTMPPGWRAEKTGRCLPSPRCRGCIRHIRPGAPRQLGPAC